MMKNSATATTVTVMHPPRLKMSNFESQELFLLLDAVRRRAPFLTELMGVRCCFTDAA